MTLRWLHLTDIHVGAQHGYLWPNVEDAVFEDLGRLHGRTGPWDAILFTGDATQRGDAAEFSRFESIRQRLVAHVETLGSSPFFFAVPGNHDLVRPSPLGGVVRLAREWSSDAQLREHFWMTENDDLRSGVGGAFANWRAWWSAARPQDPSAYREGLLPGDFVATFATSEARVGVIGLNTTFLQLEAGDLKGRLSLDARQLAALCPEGGWAWAREHDVAILMTHQPPDWLDQAGLAALRDEIAPPGRFAVHVYGHQHDARYLVVGVGGANPRCELLGCSLFGLETWDSGVQRLHGYSVAEVDGDGRTRPSLRLWPRVGIRQQAGGWRIAPDHSHVLLDDEGTEPIPLAPSPRTRPPGEAGTSPRAHGLAPDPRGQVAPAEVEASPDGKRENMRRAHRVTPVAGLEVGAPVARLPPGVYGFTVPWAIDDLRATGEWGLGLDSSPGGTAQLEVHKLTDGAITLVVYASEEIAFRLRDRSWCGDAFLYPNTWPGATEIVAVDVRRVSEFHQRPFEPTPGERRSLLDVTIVAEHEAADPTTMPVPPPAESVATLEVLSEVPIADPVTRSQSAPHSGPPPPTSRRAGRVYFVDDLREKIDDPNHVVVLVVGAGVSFGATSNPVASWTGLLEHGVQRAEDVAQEPIARGFTSRWLEALRSSDRFELLAVASLVTNMLGGHTGPEYRRWLQDTIGTLRAEDSSALDAIASLGARLMTTNYDNLLEDSTGLQPILWSDRAKLVEWLQGRRRGVLHLHGHFDYPESVVLGEDSYDRILHNELVQNVLRALLLTSTLIFVGYGEGLNDPHFRPLRAWLRDIAGESLPQRHYRLARVTEAPFLKVEHRNDTGMHIVSYGDEHADLAPFLRDLSVQSRVGDDLAPSPSEAQPMAVVGPIRNLPRAIGPCEGRDAKLGELEAALDSGGAAVVAQAFVGLGGVGKTRLALEYAHRFEQSYQVIWWISAEDAPTRNVALRDFASALDLPEQKSADDAVILTAVRTWLEQHDRWLLIFDNASRTDEVMEVMPQGRWGPATGAGFHRRHVIVTSRDPNWQTLGTVVEVAPLDRPAAERILLGSRNALATATDVDVRAAREIAERLGNLPLALAQAAAYMAKTVRSAPAYLQLLDEHGLELLRGPLGPDDYAHSVETSWKISVDAVRSRGAGGDKLLAMASFLAADAVPRGLFTAAPDAPPDLQSAAFRDTVSEDVALASLRDFSLVTVESDESFSVHRLVQEVTRRELDPATAISTCRAVLALVDRAFPGTGDDVATWERCAALLPHALVPIDHAAALGEDVVPPARLLHNIGVYRQARTEYRAAKGHYHQAREVARRATDPAGQAVAANSIGIVQWHLGDWSAARAHLEEAIQLFAALGDADGEAACANNLGLLDWDEGDWHSACDRLQASLGFTRPRIGENGNLHARLAGTLRNLAHVYWDRAKWSDAIEACKQAVEVCERSGYRRGIAQSVNSLGLIYWDIGRWTDARACHERALRELVDEPDDVVKCGTYNCMGFVLSSAGNFDGPDGAFAAHERAHNVATKIGDHHGRAVALNNVGLSRLRRGDYGPAREAFESARRLLDGLDVRASTVASLNGLGLAWAEEEAWGQAIGSHQTAHDIASQFGARQDQAVCCSDLGVVFACMKDFASAFARCDEALEIYRRLEDAHGEATALNDYGVVFGHKSEWPEAEDRFTASKALRDRIDDRHGQAVAINNLGVAAAYRGDDHAAIEYCTRSAGLFREIGDPRYAEVADANASPSPSERARRQDRRAANRASRPRTLRDLRDRHGEVFTLDNLGLVDSHRPEWPSPA